MESAADETQVYFRVAVTPFLFIVHRWLNPLFKTGHKRRLEEDDMYSVLPEDRSRCLGEQLQRWAPPAGEGQGGNRCVWLMVRGLLPSSGPFWIRPPTWRAPPPRAVPALSLLCQVRETGVSRAFVEAEGAPENCPRRRHRRRRLWVPLPALLGCSGALRPAELGRSLCPETGTSPPGLAGASGPAHSLPGALQTIGQRLWDSGQAL